MANVYIITSLNEWVSNKNMTRHHIKNMMKSIQKKSKNKLTTKQLIKKETENGIEYHFKWVKDHVIFEKILKQYQINLIDKGILIAYRKYGLMDHTFDDTAWLNFSKSKVSEDKEFYVYVKDLYTERIVPPKEIYHITDKKYRESIRQNGLLLKSSDEGNWSKELKLSYPPTVFAINNHDYWSNKLSTGEDIWVIDTTKLDNKWWRDLNFYNLPRKHDQVFPYMTFDNVPPDSIKLLYNTTKSVNERKNYGDLYHFTLLIFLTMILKTDRLGGSSLRYESERTSVKWGGKYTDYISFTRDKSFIRRSGEFLLSGGKSALVVDGETMSDHFKIRPFNHFHKFHQPKRDESEETLLLRDRTEITGIKRYIKSLIVPSFKNFSKEMKSYYFEGGNLPDNIDDLNTMFSKDFYLNGVIDNPNEMRLLYEFLINYIKESEIPYEIY
jgi:hypothetical protein